MNAPDDWKCWGNPAPVCPHCGHVESDAWEWNLNEGSPEDHDCGACEQPFTVVKSITVTYDTRPTDHPTRDAA